MRCTDSLFAHSSAVNRTESARAGCLPENSRQRHEAGRASISLPYQEIHATGSGDVYRRHLRSVIRGLIRGPRLLTVFRLLSHGAPPSIDSRIQVDAIEFPILSVDKGCRPQATGHRNESAGYWHSSSATLVQAVPGLDKIKETS